MSPDLCGAVNAPAAWPVTFYNTEEVLNPGGAADQQAITCCFAVDYLEGQDHSIERPAEYDFWRDYTPKLQPAWPRKLLDLSLSDPISLKPVSRGFDPRAAGAGLWVYRRILDPRNFEPGAYPGSSGTTLVNWPQNDYLLGPLVGPSIAPEAAKALGCSETTVSWRVFTARRAGSGPGPRRSASSARPRGGTGPTPARTARSFIGMPSFS